MSKQDGLQTTRKFFISIYVFIYSLIRPLIALLVGRSRDRFPVVSLDFSMTYSFRPYLNSKINLRYHKISPKFGTLSRHGIPSVAEGHLVSRGTVGTVVCAVS